MQTTAIGVSLYKIKRNGSLHGKWTVASDKAHPPGTSDGTLGIEIATPLKQNRKSLAGKYEVIICKNDKEIFSGHLIIKELKENAYKMSWMKGKTTMYTGYGVKRRRNLAANYWASC